MSALAAVVIKRKKKVYHPAGLEPPPHPPLVPAVRAKAEKIAIVGYANKTPSRHRMIANRNHQLLNAALRAEAGMEVEVAAYEVGYANTAQARHTVDLDLEDDDDDLPVWFPTGRHTSVTFTPEMEFRCCSCGHACPGGIQGMEKHVLGGPSTKKNNARSGCPNFFGNWSYFCELKEENGHLYGVRNKARWGKQ